jgi:hypothetical protein
VNGLLYVLYMMGMCIANALPFVLKGRTKGAKYGLPREWEKEVINLNRASCG